jgi:hypothetical protein
LQLAWSHERSYLPLLIERIDFAEQAEYWLEGSRWIEATAEPPDHWLSQTLQSLSQSGVRFHDTELPTLTAGQAVQPIPLTRLDRSLQSLRRIARFTDRISPLPAAARPRSANPAAIRGLGAPQEDAQRGRLIGGLDDCVRGGNYPIVGVERRYFGHPSAVGSSHRGCACQYVPPSPFELPSRPLIYSTAFLILATHRSGFLESWHSQIRMTAQPFVRRAEFTRRSRLLLPATFSFQ